MTQTSSQMHPKRRRDAGATRAAIFEAATRRFACQGYQYAGVREIAADAGCGGLRTGRHPGPQSASDRGHAAAAEGSHRRPQPHRRLALVDA